MYFLLKSLCNRYDIVKLYEVCNYLTYLTLQSMSVSLECGTRPLVILYQAGHSPLKSPKTLKKNWNRSAPEKQQPENPWIFHALLKMFRIYPEKQHKTLLITMSRMSDFRYFDDLNSKIFSNHGGLFEKIRIVKFSSTISLFVCNFYSLSLF